MIKLVLTLMAAGLLLSCLPSSQPDIQVIERKCALVDLDPKPSIPAIEFVTRDEGCSHFRCMTEENFYDLETRDDLLRNEVNYCREVYTGAKERCK